jgi:hypothetical protein
MLYPLSYEGWRATTLARGVGGPIGHEDHH